MKLEIVIFLIFAISSAVTAKRGDKKVKSWWKEFGSLAQFKMAFENSVENEIIFDVSFCSKFFKTGTQRRICRSNIAAGNAAGLVSALDMAVHLALKECKEQFKADKWNCPLEWEPSRWQSGFSPESVAFLEQGTKEAAFIVAAISAALTHTVAHACSIGNLTGCSCNQNTKVDNIVSPQQTTTMIYSESSFLSGIRESSAATAWQWSGCAENVHFGSYMSRKFLDPPALKQLRRNANDMLPLVQLQNLLLGRKTLTSQLRVNCRCHGLSASCSVKTCFRQPSPFRKIAKSLRDKYEHALLASSQPELNEAAVNAVSSVTRPTEPTEPEQVDQPGLPIRSRLIRRKARVSERSQPSFAVATAKSIMSFIRKSNVMRNNMIVYKKSPNFCLPSSEWPHGTRGRECSIDSDRGNSTKSLSSCGDLCCGRGYDSKLVYVAEPCRCEFKWCCEIKCETCWTTREVHTCK